MLQHKYGYKNAIFTLIPFFNKAITDLEPRLLGLNTKLQNLLV